MITPINCQTNQTKVGRDVEVFAAVAAALPEVSDSASANLAHYLFSNAAKTN
jgi:hypothetical protein